MKYIITIFALVVVLQTNAQTKEKATTTFIAALNNLVTHTTIQHWAFDTPFTVDSAFHLNGDSITATFRYKTDSSFFRIRYAAPINKISTIGHDMYLMMVFKGNQVLVQQQIADEGWELYDTRNLFHIGLAETDEQLEIKKIILKAWEELKVWYKP